MATWTQEKLEELVRDWQSGMTLDEMGVKFGVSRTAIGNQVCLLRKSGVPLTDRKRTLRANIDYAALTELAKNGHQK